MTVSIESVFDAFACFSEILQCAREVHDRRSKVSDEQLNSAQVALADGIAERLVSAIRRDQDRTPERILQQEMARQMVAALHKDGTLKPLTKFGAGRNRGPPLDEDQPAAMTIPEFLRLGEDQQVDALRNVVGRRRPEIPQGRHDDSDLPHGGRPVACRS